VAKNKTVRVEIVAGTKNFLRGMKRAASGVKTFASKAKRFLGSVVKAVAAIGVAFTAITGAITGVLWKSAAAFAGLETKIVEVGTLLKTWGKDSFDNIKTEAQALAIAFGQTTEAMLGAKYDIVSAGFTKAAESATVLRASVKAATAGLVDAATSANLIISSLRGYQREAKDATDVSDILFTTVRLGRTTFRELAQSLPVVIPTAKAAGVSFKALGAAMAVITLGGIDTRMAAVSLNRLFLSMSAPTGEAAEAMKELGIVVTDTKGKMLPLIDVIKQFRGKSLAQVKAIAGDVRSARAILALAQNFDKFQDILGEFKDTANATDIAYRKMSNTIAFRAARTAASWAAMWQNLGETFAEETKALLDKVTVLFSSIASVIKANKAGIGAAIGSMLDWVLQKVKDVWAAVIEMATGGELDAIFKNIQIGINFMVAAMPAIVWNIIQIAFKGMKWLWRKSHLMLMELKIAMLQTINEILSKLPGLMGGITPEAAAIANRYLDDFAKIERESPEFRTRGIEQSIAGDIKDIGRAVNETIDFAAKVARDKSQPIKAAVQAIDASVRSGLAALSASAKKTAEVGANLAKVTKQANTATAAVASLTAALETIGGDPLKKARRLYNVASRLTGGKESVVKAAGGAAALVPGGGALSVVLNVAGSVVSEENLITNIAKGLERRAQQGSFNPKARS